MSAAPPADMSSADAPDAVRRARAYLVRVAEPPAVALTAFVDAHGPVVAAARVRADDVPDAVREEIAERRDQDRVDEDLTAAARIGARLVVPEDAEWPAWQLLCLSVAADRGLRWSGLPLGLWARGPLSMAETFDRAVSVVGARSATPYGEHVAADVAFGLAEDEVTVVSGTRYGVEGAALRGALSANGAAVAILPSGIDLVEPSEHTRLVAQIAERGLLVSEHPPRTPPARRRVRHPCSPPGGPVFGHGCGGGQSDGFLSRHGTVRCRARARRDGGSRPGHVTGVRWLPRADAQRNRGTGHLCRRDPRNPHPRLYRTVAVPVIAHA